jgi:hypothetical protein
MARLYCDRKKNDAKVNNIKVVSSNPLWRRVLDTSVQKDGEFTRAASGSVVNVLIFVLWCLTPFSAIFQLYRGG